MEIDNILYKRIEYRGKFYTCNGIKTVNHKIVIITEENRTLVMYPSEFGEVIIIPEKEKEVELAVVRKNPEHKLNHKMVLVLESGKESRRGTNQTKWTAFEDALVIEREREGVCRKAIATYMKRTLNAVNARVSYLNRLEEEQKRKQNGV